MVRALAVNECCGGVQMVSGRCECGGVSFEVPAVRPSVTMCHCKQCRRLSGHHWAATDAPFDSVVFVQQTSLKWYTSSTWARRGFCDRCGSSLFYLQNESDQISIAAGCLDEPAGLVPGRHIFTVDKGDYYVIADDAPHVEKY